MDIKQILYNLPEVTKPTEKKLSFNVKLKWTLIVLVVYSILSTLTLYGLETNSLQRFEYLEVILGTQFGSIISLGIGPIVMASIILQLLVGSGIMKIDTNTSDGKKYFQGLQKLGVLFFIVFEALVYVLMGGFRAMPGFTTVLVVQLMLGGLIIMFMDEVTTKWGFGSGVSLFIVAGVARSLFTSLFQFIGPAGENCLVDFSNTPCVGRVFVIIQSVINGAPTEALLASFAIVITAAIFLVVVFAQSLKVEIPLSFDRIRGYSMKWPLAFFYSSVIPVILVSALAANFQLFAGLMESWLGHPTFLGTFQSGVASSGIAFWLSHSNLLEAVIRGSFTLVQIAQSITHILFYATFSAIFAVLWVKTSGMDEYSQAKKIMASGLQIPGFRKDERILEAILKRYILPLTIMGGLAIGLLAAVSDTLGALTGGTSILLSVMIMYQMYQNIAHQHAVDMHPALRKMIGE